MRIRPWFASVVLYIVFAQSIVNCSQAAAQIQALNLEIVEGEGAVNNVRQRMARAPMVQVTDENRKPVAGAVVVFLLPNQGAGATFANGARSLTVVTDTNGNAVAQGLQSNQVPGKYQIRVSASHQGKTVSTSINVTNMAVAGAVAGGLAAKWLIILGVVGGAAAGGAVAATRGGGGSSPGTPPRGPTTVTPGTPSAGAPQ